ncbi:metallophosphoesterase domain-containing protein [Tieghemostelium lacteum]|uniref:Metallophosphoesterase domain-containing protein n=1 Tax=Tieghemostelium lacteum TaxID=361077 RepID=A0A151Z564_TIELA|nr:metallophosphoesterase domain-containing protein [Tieghemostelium lacteum]|eukprot:KYQ89102.1 metallophosphoesterase domain-containing protein [Tieghemostelium lacteum]
MWWYQHIIIVIVLLITITIVENVELNYLNNVNTLYFNENSQFKIIQFTDLHYGEGESTDWGPEQDINSTRVMNTILDFESPVDLIVFTGDLVTGNNVVSNATKYWQEAVQVAIDRSIPWIVAFGNHDDLSSGTGGSRDDLMAFDQSLGSLSQFGPLSIPGVSNYYINLQNSMHEMIGRLWVFDSGDGSCPPGNDGRFTGSKYQCNTYITNEQIQWYLNESDPTLFAMAFFHIPLQEYMDLWNYQTCFGYNNDSVACQPVNEGLYNAFEKVGDVKVVTVGHNHGNDYIGSIPGHNITMCYGRHSGYGGYGTWERGARVFQLQANPFTNDITYETWIRYETGQLQFQQPIHYPNQTNPQTQCTV